MKRVWAVGVVLAAGVGVGAWAPVPEGAGKAAAFPAGGYVLGGGPEAARAPDARGFKKPFRLRPGQYVLSGGSAVADLIDVDDDLEVLQADKSLFVDDDRVASLDVRGDRPTRYRGLPLILALDPAKPVRVRATDAVGVNAVLGSVWLHRWDGARKKLTDGTRGPSAALLPAVFFDEAFPLADGWEFPRGLSYDAPATLPERLAMLKPSVYVRQAVLDGLAEDGVDPKLAAGLLGRPDFVPKCPLCDATRAAFREYAGRETAPAPAVGRGLPADMARRLAGEDAAPRRAALRELIDRYAGRGYERHELTGEVRAGVEAGVGALRMAPKNPALGFGDGLLFCPSCDGACRVRPAARPGQGLLPGRP